MSYYKDVKCVRCGGEISKNFYDACEKCKSEGFNINFETLYDLKGAKLPFGKSDLPGIFKYKDFLPIGKNDPYVSLNEGNTPLYKLERMGKILGLNNLYVKDESKNPTCSHKDRLCSIIVSKALADKAPGMTVSSTGNQGVSVAAYASAVNLPCYIFTTPNVSSTMKTIMQVHGAYVFITPTMADRGIIMEKLVRDFGFVPASGLMSPPIGSSCFGIDGYKTIAYEIFEQMDKNIPEWVVFPISYGDGMYGMYKGFKDLQEMGYIKHLPKIAAAEAFGSLKKSIEDNQDIPVKVDTEPSIQTSIAVPYTTYQSIKAIKDSNGIAECSTDAQSLEMQKILARTEGIYAETASVASLVVVKKLLESGKIKHDEKVVVVITSIGTKDPDTTKSALPEVPHINPVMDNLKKSLQETYGIKF